MLIMQWKMIIDILGFSPKDLMRSSLPYSYLEVEVSSLDGNDHNVQLYTDISAEWVSGDHSANAQWSYGLIQETATPKSWGPPASATWPASESLKVYGTKTAYQLTPSVAHTQSPIRGRGQGWRPGPGNWKPHGSPPHPTGLPHQPPPPQQTGAIAYHQVYRQQQLNFSETNQQADWGYWYYATQNTADLTYQQGQDIVVRGQFIDAGYLNNTQDDNYRPINDDWPVFAFSTDLGKVSTQTISTLFQLSLHQHYCVQFEGANGTQSVPCMWTNYFDSDLAAVEYFYSDYAKEGSSLATSLDMQVERDSITAGGQNYLSLTSLAVRQAFGALEFTNTPDTPWVFLKEISSDGNVNTVDVIFPFHPIAIYMNEDILKWLLDPLFINQEAGNWPYQFSIRTYIVIYDFLSESFG